MSQPTCNLFCIILLTEFITMIYWSDSELLLDFHPRVFSKCLQKSLIGGVLLMYLSSSLYLFSSLLLSFCWSGHVFSLLWSNVSKVKSLKEICHCHCLCLCICLCWSGHVSSWLPSVLQDFGLVWKAGRLEGFESNTMTRQ